MDYYIGSVAVAALIFGIVEAAKEFGLAGKACRLLVLILGIFFVAIAAAEQEGLISEQVMTWIKLVTTSAAGGLAAMGYYDFTKRQKS
jgi:hypothetical protein